ncbi:MAG: transcriptional antiterminator [Woeseia sp.]|jgi:Rho-binding antiterminator|nr:transcriptional antiterminator [Woeseia sp.]MBT6208884.1 transcriptional antiterminator [Woeseia sp.]
MVDSKYSPIDCGDYDYLEIACMYRYDVEVLANGKRICGTAVNLEVIDGEEFLLVDVADAPANKIRVDHIGRMTVNSWPCRFVSQLFSA